jgi:hypothetical protein
MDSDVAEMVMRKVRELGMPSDGADDAGWGPDTGDPDDDETGDPRSRRRIMIAEDYLYRALQELRRAEKIEQADLVAFMQLLYRQGHRMGHRRGYRRGVVHKDMGVHWGRSRRMHEFRRYIIDRYRSIHNNNVIEGPGFYYGTIEAQFQTESTANGSQAIARIAVPGSGTPGVSPIIDSCFNLGIGDTSLTWFGGVPHTLNSADTNLQNPGLNLYADEVFIIEAIQATIRGIRLQYNPVDLLTAVAPASTAGTVTNGVLSGQIQVWDQAGEILPPEFFNQYSDTIRLAKLLAETSTLHFTWIDKSIGGGGTTTDAQIQSFLNVPGSYHRQDLRRTSGGGLTLDLPQGYIWCLDKMFQASSDQGGNGLFDAQLNLDESMAIPFTPLTTYGMVPGTINQGGNACVPTGFALYWELTLFGTALLPGRFTDDFRYDIARWRVNQEPTRL